MKRQHLSHSFAAGMLAILLFLTLLVQLSQTIWASVSKPDAPAGAVSLWEASTSAPDSPGVTPLRDDTILAPDYFGAKYISGVTSAEPFGPWDNRDVTRTAHPSDKLVSARIPAGDDSFMGQLGIFYRNVGNHNGHPVDLKATLVNYDFYQNDGISSQMIFWARTNRIGFCVAGESYIDVRYDYFDGKTGEPLSLKAFMTFDDVDCGQAIQVLENPGQLFAPAASNLRCIIENGAPIFLSDAAWYDDRTTAAHNSASEDAFMTMFEGSTQLQRFYCGYYFREGFKSSKNFLADYQDDAALQSFCDNLDYFGYSGQPLAPSTPSTPVKEVADSDESGIENTLFDRSESYTYSIYHNIPNENPEHYYKSYQISDTLADCLLASSFSVFDEHNNDVTEDFSISQEGQTVIFKASDTTRSDFYYNTYRFVIEVKLRGDFDLTPYQISSDEVETIYAIKNHASVSITRGDTINRDTNETCTYVSEAVEIPPTESMEITKTASVIHGKNRDVSDSGSNETPVLVEQGDLIEYQIDVTRSCTPGYLSEAFTVTDQIPEGALWSKDSLHIHGEILDPTEDSQAVVEAAQESDGVITWTISGLDDQERAHLTFQIEVPKKEIHFINTALLHIPEKPDLPSNETHHQSFLPALSAEKTSNPASGTSVSAGTSITYGVTIKNTGKACAYNVIIRDFVPDGTSYTEDSVKCSDSAAKIGYRTSDRMVYGIIPKLEVGKSAAISFRVSVDKTITLSEVKNTAQFAEGGNDPFDKLTDKDGFSNTNTVRHPLKKIEKRGDSKTPVSSSSKTGAVKTGDTSHLLFYAAAAVASLLLFFLLFLKKKSHSDKTNL